MPDVLYHVTSGDRIDAIKKNGLKLGQDRSTKEGIIAGVYLADDPREIFGSGDMPLRNPQVIAVKTKGLKLRFDPEFYDYSTAEELHKALKSKDTSYMVYSKKPIPASAIQSISPLPRTKELM